MKKRILSTVLILLLCFSSVVQAHAALEVVDFDVRYEDSVSWDDLLSGGNETKPVSKVVVSLKVGEKGQVSLWVRNRPDSFSWTSLDSSIAVLTKGSMENATDGGYLISTVVTAVGAGSTQILATVNGSNLYFPVKVKKLTPKSVKLSQVSFVYNKKTQKPAVTVTGVDGKRLSSTDYQVSYPKKSVKPGVYTVTVTMKKHYTGTKKLTYRILPKGTSIVKTKGTKKGFSLTWKKKTVQSDGYQIEYATGKKMQSAKKILVKKNGKTSYTFKSLKGKKNYYVRIRTYRTVKQGEKTVKVYSKWSEIKKVRTK